MDETPNWLEMPQELMRMILQRLGAVEVLNSAQKVCTTWRRICKDPAMWKVIDLRDSYDARKKGYDLQELDNQEIHHSPGDWVAGLSDFFIWNKGYELENLAKQAIHRSCGELIDINIECFGSDELLDHISRCSSKLNCLRLVNHPTLYGSNGNKITSSGLSHAVKRLPYLEKLHLIYIEISVEDIEIIGCSCPLLKSFTMNREFRWVDIDFDGEAIAIANNMPELRHLQLYRSNMTNNGLQAILHGCPHLESLDLRRCSKLDLGGNLGKLCMEQIKDLKLPDDPFDDCDFYHITMEDFFCDEYGD